MEKIYKGMNEIRQALNGISEPTAMDLILHEGLPAKKVDGVYQMKKFDLQVWQDPELSTRKATADKKAKAAAIKTALDPDPAEKKKSAFKK
jgi:hypothetical protein